MIPHTLVLKPGLVIEQLRRDLYGVTREIRPDWDPSSPGLRENWETGDRSMHYAYNAADLRAGP
jgi:hypothetical protein